MVHIKPFAALRPPVQWASEIACPPYDVVDSAEARALAGERSLLHIIRPEIDFTPLAGEHEPRAYAKAAENFGLWKQRGYLVQDKAPGYYVYAQTMGGRTQRGIVLTFHWEDYENGTVKRHELTRRDKEDDRLRHILTLDAQLEPVFLAYKDNEALEALTDEITRSAAPVYRFVDENKVEHALWPVQDASLVTRITQLFSQQVEAFYVADGHHRTAAAVRAAKEKMQANPAHTGQEEYNYIMAVCFPQRQLSIMDYNRVVRDLNGLSPEEFLRRVEEAGFGMEPVDSDSQVPGEGAAPAPSRLVSPAPSRPHEFGMYLKGQWYRLKAAERLYDPGDPIAALDVTVLSRHLLDGILGIHDLRTDPRIAFVGGIRGLGALSGRVDSGEMQVAFALYPVSMAQLFAIADSGAIMPPKTTWFEPKLRSGLFVHAFQ